MKTRVFFCLLGITFLLCTAKTARATTYTTNFVWLGQNSSSWTDLGNWIDGSTLGSVNCYPGQTASTNIVTILTIPIFGSDPVLSSSYTIAQLTFGQILGGDQLTISSGKTLTVTGSITNSAYVSTTIAGPGTIIGASAITLNGSSTLTTNTTIAAASLTTTGGSTTLSMSAAVTVTGAVTVNGSTTISGGALLTGASLSLTSTDILTLNTPMTITGSATSANNVSPTVSIGAGYTLAITGSFTNGNTSTSGLTITGAGKATMAGFTYGYQSSFTIGGPSTNTTTVTLNAGSTLDMAQNNANFNNYATLNLLSGCKWKAPNTSPSINNSGTINLTNTTSNWDGNSLQFTNNGTVAATSVTKITFAGNPQSFTNSGSFSLDTSTMTSSGNTTPIVNSGNFTLSHGSAITVSGGGSSPFTNSGTFTANSSAINFTAGTGNAVSNTSTGVFSATKSPITFGGGAWTLTNSGTFSAVTNSPISMPGNNSYISNTAGTFTVNLSNIKLTGQPSSLRNSGSGTVSVSDSTITLAQSAYLSHTSSNAFTVTGTAIVNFGNGAYITSSGSGLFTINGASTVNLLGNAAYIMSSGSGTFTINGASTVNFGNGAYITSSGTGPFNAGTSGSSCVLNLTTANAYITNSGKFNLGSTSIIYPTASSTKIINTGTFTLQSDANGSAAIAAFNSGASSTGTFNVERYFQGSTLYDNVKKRWLGRNYRIISSPVNIGGGNNVFGLNYIVGATAGSTTAANSTTNAFATGCAGCNTTAGNPSFYLFNEAKVPSNATFTSGNFIGITDITKSSLTTSTPAGAIITSAGATAYNIPIGNGVLFFFRGNASSWATRTASPYIAPENVTLTSTGSINQQSVTVKNWYSSSSSNLGYTGSGTAATTNYAVRGFNMVGNPYPCSIDWNTAYSGTAITRTNINPTIWVFNPVTNQYDTWKTTSLSGGVGNTGGSATNIIASGQGFFVQASAASPALVFTEAAKLATAQVTGSNLLMGTPVADAKQQLLRLRLTIDSLNYDDMLIGFNSSTSAKYNGEEDAEYLPGMNAMEGLSSYSSDGVRLSMNFLPLPKQTPQVIKLDVEAKLTGLYEFQRIALDAIPQIYEIWLMDHYKKDSLDIRNNATYAFNVDLADTNSYGSSRFTIVIRQSQALNIHLLNFTATKTSDGADVVWKTENEQNYTNFTVERSSDGGKTFNVLGGFASTGRGTYSFLDKTPPAAADQYRLKIEDLNGIVAYSKIVTLIYGSGGTIASSGNINVYPNPANGVINLAINKPGSVSYSSNSSTLQKLSTTPGITAAQTTANAIYGIKIINITGSVVTTATSSQPTWQNNIGNLLPGTYIIEVVNNNDNSLVGKSTFVKL